jgi:hypothetical protein
MWWPAVVQAGQRLVTTWVYKPEAANTLVLLMMSGMPLETCWAFNKFWNNKFYYKVASCWLFLLIVTSGSNINDRNCNTRSGFTYTCRVSVFKNPEDGGGIPPGVNLNGTCAFLVVCGCHVVLFGYISLITLRRDVSNVDGGCFDYCGKYVEWRDV